VYSYGSQGTDRSVKPASYNPPLTQFPLRAFLKLSAFSCKRLRYWRADMPNWV
jgi:hypothetical protein